MKVFPCHPILLTLSPLTASWALLVDPSLEVGLALIDCLHLSHCPQIQLLTPFICLTAMTTKYIKVFFHALRQNFKKAPICSSSGVQERQWWVQDILRHCAKYVHVYWKHSGQLWRNTWQVGWPELVAFTGNRNLWGTYRVKQSLWTPIAEQHVLYVHCSRNRRELWHKYTAENVKVHPRATSRLKTIQPLHPLRAKPDALHSGS